MTFVTHELPRQRWASYLGEIGEGLPPSQVSIETVGGPRGPGARSEQPMLEGFAYDERQDLFVVLTRRGSARGPRLERHAIRRPVRIRTDGPDGLPPATIVVDAADGSCTVVRIEPVPAFTG